MDYLRELENDHQATLWKAALRRLEDAWELLEPPTRLSERSDKLTRHLAAAEYLAGYSVECLLKVRLIQRTVGTAGKPVQRWREVIAFREMMRLEPDLSGSRSHQIDRLVVASELEPELDEHTKRIFGTVYKWRPSLRYRAIPQGDLSRQRQRVLSVVSACQAACDWLRSRMILDAN